MNITNQKSPRDQAWKIIKSYSGASATTTIATGPLPGTSLVLASIEAKMCYEIARVYGYHPSMKEAGTVAGGLLGASMGLKSIAIEASTFFPFIGYAIKTGIAYVGCQAIGAAIIEYYEDKS